MLRLDSHAQIVYKNVYCIGGVKHEAKGNGMK